jgi:hypothetical protein
MSVRRFVLGGKDVFRPGAVLVSSVTYLLLRGQGAAGQTVGSTTGAIEGTVTDTTGAVLPGVTITAASDALRRLADCSTRFPPPARSIGRSPPRPCRGHASR